MDEFWGVSNKKYARILKRLQEQPFTRDAEKLLGRYKDMLNEAVSNFNTEYSPTKKELNNIRNDLERGRRPWKPNSQMWYEGKISSLNNLIKNSQNLVDDLRKTDNVNLNQVAGVVSRHSAEFTAPQRARLEHILRQLGKANKYLNAIPLGELGVGLDHLQELDSIINRERYDQKLKKMFNDYGINYLGNGQYQL